MRHQPIISANGVNYVGHMKTAIVSRTGSTGFAFWTTNLIPCVVIAYHRQGLAVSNQLWSSSLVYGGIKATSTDALLVGSIDNGRSLRVSITTEIQDVSLTNGELNGRHGNMMVFLRNLCVESCKWKEV